uniref:Uncharacterized protein n=1 Tax=Tanacetum cinerariifolium TaxID=118510 RepID=A0A699L948_TANCI|nr:hypothetical protein [Tanacetum cinerariifolium]
MRDPIGGLVSLVVGFSKAIDSSKRWSSGGVMNLTSDKDPIDDDRDTGVGDSEVSVSLGEISSGGRNYQESSIGDTKDGGKAVGRAITV